MTDQPTTWKATPKGATEEMIAAGVVAVRQRYPYMSPRLARAVVELVWTSMWRASPVPPPIENDPEVGDRTDG